MRRSRAEELGLTWLAEIGAHGVVAGPDSTLQSQPARAIARACEREGIAPTDLDLVEINEAFAAVGLASAKELGHRRGQGQRQRRCHRPRPPDRHVRRPHRAPPRARAAAPRRRRRCGGAVRRWRPGRRPRRQGPRAGLTGLTPIGPRSRRRPLPRRPGEGGASACGRPADLARRGRPPGAARGDGRARAGCRTRTRRRRHRGARRREVDDDQRARGGVPRRRASASACSRSTRRRPSPAERCSVTGSGCRTTPPTPSVFIRSMASRGHLGGLSWAAPQALRVLDAAGCDVVLLETVGRRAVRGRGGRHGRHDRRAARARDGRRHPGGQGRHPRGRRRARRQQGRPRGRRPHRARPAARGVAGARTRPGGWRVPVVRTVATDGTGVDDLARAPSRRTAGGSVTTACGAGACAVPADEIEGLALEVLRARVGGLRGDARLDVARRRGGRRAHRPVRRGRPAGRPRSAERVRSLRGAMVRHDVPVHAAPAPDPHDHAVAVSPPRRASSGGGVSPRTGR